MIKILLLSFILLPFYSFSIEFSNSIDNSKWTLIQNSVFECTLQQKINNYGFFYLSFYSKNKSISKFQPYNKPSISGNAFLSFIPFSWSFNPSISQTIKIPYYSAFDIDLNSLSQSIENALLSNQQIHVSYNQLDHLNYSVFVNPIGFKNIYNKFNQCKSNLLPFDFSDIEFSILLFEKNSSNLIPESINILNNIITFLKHSTEPYSLSIESHSDSYGSKQHNMDLSSERSQYIFNKLKPYLKDIVIHNYGEKRLVSSNQTPDDREKNRRIILKINKI